MIRIIDTTAQIESLFDNQRFSIDKWERYINSILPNSAYIFKNDLNECFASGDYTFDKDFLPIINAVYKNPKAEKLHTSFLSVMEELNNKILGLFNRELDVDIVLYLGLCNAAGWATEINGKSMVLLGIEKIIELDWCSEDDMRGLIYHELGHIFHKTYGIYEQPVRNSSKALVWLLFKEGFAMYFEQLLVSNTEYYHQDKNGWKQWCDDHIHQIKYDFNNDLSTMNHQTQRYFGDYVSYLGYSDVGYYLGAKFIHYLADKHSIDEIIKFDIGKIFDHYMAFIAQ